MTYVCTIYYELLSNKFHCTQVSREMLSDNYIDQRKVAFEIKLGLSNKMHVWIFVTKLIVFFFFVPGTYITHGLTARQQQLH